MRRDWKCSQASSAGFGYLPHSERVRLYDEEIVLQIQENPYLQYFCGYAGYDDSNPPFDLSSMVHFRKRLTPEILVEINEIVIQAAEKEDDQNENNSNGGGNR